MSNVTIENTPAGPYLLRCVCGETFELNNDNCLGQPMWVFNTLCAGFSNEHRDCRDPADCTLCGGDGRVEDSEGRDIRCRKCKGFGKANLTDSERD